MLKLKIHPLFIIYAIILVIQNRYTFLLTSLLAVLIHESAHARVAYNLGYKVDVISLLPYGAMLGCKEPFSRDDSIKIAFAGPCSNILLCTVLLALWWLSPELYAFTRTLFKASLTIGAFNLLPIYPLDGATILKSICKNEKRIVTIQKTLGMTLSGITFILFLTSFFYSPNLNLGIIGALFYVASIKSEGKANYERICNNCLFIKNLDGVITKTNLIVHQNLKILRLLKHIKPNTETTFEIVDDNLNKVKTLSETELMELALTQNIHLPIIEFLRP